jgi:uncharacterized membrane protein
MSMKRLKSIDILRGSCIVLMVFVHSIEWWLRPEDQWLFFVFYAIFADIAAGIFVLVAGISVIISHRNRYAKTKISENYDRRMVKKEYNLRALILLTIALIFNCGVAIMDFNIFNIWIWFIPQTIAISLLCGSPVLKTSKRFRLILAAIIWIVNYALVSFLLQFEGKPNFFGVISHFLYNSLDLHPILYYFSYFLIGTIVGDFLYDIYNIKNQYEMKEVLRKKFLLPSLIIGVIFITFGIILLFPNFLVHNSISSIIFSLGVILTLLSILLFIEESEIVKVKKSYRFFFYYSYYSFTIFFAHWALYFVFLGKLNAFNIWFVDIGSIILLTLLLREIYKRYTEKISLKVQIGKIAALLAKLYEEKQSKNLNKI